MKQQYPLLFVDKLTHLTSLWERFPLARFHFTVVALFVCCLTTEASALTAQQIAKKALAATVLLEMEDSTGKTLGIGSGFFVRQNLIATNFHVIAGAARGTAKLVGKSTKYTIEGFTATDEENDLALLKVTVSGVQPLLIGDSDTVETGETVYVVGNPKGLEDTFSGGIISSTPLRENSAQKRFQMTAQISPGSSGGPVLNNKGQVIGVSYRMVEGGQGPNFAIPSNYIKALLARSGTTTPLAEGSQSISAVIYFSRGLAKASLGEHAAAILDYDSAIRLQPDDVAAYTFRGLAKVSLGEYTSAILDYDSAIRLQPDDADAYTIRGLAKASLGEYTSAILDYDSAIRLNPDYAGGAYYNRGLAKASLGEYTSAILDYDSAIRLQPDYAGGAYYNRGLAKASLGEYTSAILDYDSVIRLQPDYADAYTGRGNAKSDLGEYTSAILDYDSAIRLQPDYAAAYHNRGNAKVSLGEYTSAILDYDSAIRLQPDDADAYTIRGLAKAILGEHASAKADLRTALRLAKKAGNESLKTSIEEELRKLE